MKRICIDLTGMNPLYRGGVNTYIYGLINGFHEIKTNYQINIVCTQEIYKNLKLPKKKNIKFIRVTKPYRFYSILLKISILLNLKEIYFIINNIKWEKITKICDNNGDLVYIPTTILNGYNGKKPRVLSIHDIQHIHYPKNFKYFELRSRQFAYDLSIKYAHSIQASSNFIKNDLLKNFKFLKKKKIPVIREGIDIKKFKVNRKIKSILANKYLFYPAQLWPHKDHLTILKALKKLDKKYNISIIFTGEKLSAYKKIRDFVVSNNLNRRVHILGLVKFEKLKNIYEQSFSIIVAAKYESSSLPILEAAKLGSSIIASDTQPNKELAKFLRIKLFKVSNPESLKDAILYFIKNPKKKKKMIISNLKKIEKFDWKNSSSQYIKYFSSIK